MTGHATPRVSLTFQAQKVFNHCIIKNTTEWSFCPASILPFLLSFLEISGKCSKATHTLSPTGWSNAINILLYFLGFPPKHIKRNYKDVTWRIMFLKVDLSELGLMEQTHKPSPQKTVLLGTPLHGSSELSQVHHRVSQLQHSSYKSFTFDIPSLCIFVFPWFSLCPCFLVSHRALWKTVIFKSLLVTTQISILVLVIRHFFSS